MRTVRFLDTPPAHFLDARNARSSALSPADGPSAATGRRRPKAVHLLRLVDRLGVRQFRARWRVGPLSDFDHELLRRLLEHHQRLCRPGGRAEQLVSFRCVAACSRVWVCWIVNNMIKVTTDVATSNPATKRFGNPRPAVTAARADENHGNR